MPRPTPRQNATSQARLRRLLEVTPRSERGALQLRIGRLIGFKGSDANVARSVRRIAARPDQSTYRKIGDVEKARGINRIFNRRKKTVEGLYYDKFLNRGEYIEITQFLKPTLNEEEIALFIAGPSNDQPWEPNTPSTVFEIRPPRILFKGPGIRKSQVIQLLVIENDSIPGFQPRDIRTPLVDDGMPPLGVSGSSFGDLGDRDLGVRAPRENDLLTFYERYLRRVMQQGSQGSDRWIFAILRPDAGRQILGDDNPFASEIEAVVKYAQPKAGSQAEWNEVRI